MAPSPRVFDFPPFRLDTGQGVLLRNGERVPLIPKAVDLLAVLVAEAGRVVSKEQLLERVWPDAFVQEGNLSKLVFLLRRELEAAGSSRIETVSKRGYVFRGAVTDATAPLDSGTTPAARTVAVLPFAAVGGAPPHLSESLADEVLVALSRGGELSVVARTSSFKFGAGDVDVRDAGRRLGVAWLVEGSVRADGDRVRVTASLVEGATAFQRWTETFDRSQADLAGVPEAIATRIAAALLPSPPSAPRSRHPVDPHAYELYLQGRYLWNRRPGEATWQALECFQQAARLDPAFAEAWAGMADVYSTLGSWEAGVLPHDEAQEQARGHAQRALELDPHLAAAHATLAYTALHYKWDPAAAEAGFARALRGNPAYAAAHHWLSHALIAQGRVAESLAASRAALAHDPMNLLLTVHMSWHHHMAREQVQALDAAERAVRMDPHFHWGHYFLAWAAEAGHDPARAVEAARAAVRCLDDAVMRAALGRALAVAGDRAGARAVAEVLARDDEGLGRYAYELALIQLGLEDRDRALDLLGRARERRSGWMVYLRVDPRMDPLRSDPRFTALLP